MTTSKIPIKLVEVGDDSDNKNIEIMMELGDFESSGTSIRTTIVKFKEEYLRAIKDIKKAGGFETSQKSRKKVSTKDRWKACKILADFNRDAANRFLITNYKEAYSRDFGIPMRSIRTYLDFGSVFSEDEILEDIPYSLYAEFVFRANEMRRKGIVDSEKEWLLGMLKSGNLPNRDEYRKHLKTLE